MVPKQVITVFGDKHGNNYYLEARKVNKIKDDFTVGAPTPLSDDIFKELAQSYMTHKAYDMKFDGFVPQHIIYASNQVGKTIIVWYRPAMDRTLNFSKKFKIPGDGRIKIPATLAAIANDQLYYFALMTDERPDEKTKLYNAPFFNIYKSGNVCLGSAPIGKKKAKTFPLEVERFENGFFVAEQNLNHIEPCKTPLAELYGRLFKAKTPFPCKRELIQNKDHKTLADLLKFLNGNKNTHYAEEDFDDE